MDTYIGLKIIQAEPAFEPDELVAKRTGPENMATRRDGYAVVYADGYESWSPQATFDDAYRLLKEGVPFSIALESLKRGQKWTRKGWNGVGMWVAVQFPDDHSKMSRPYIYMKTADDELVPWVASQTDMLADDWVAVDAF